jgi:RND family efflux transporter MFP subunit
MVRIAPSPLVGLGLLLVACVGFTGCSRGPSGAAEKQAATVTVAYPIQREVTDYQDYTGRTAAVDSVQVQARVTGYLDKIYFTEGAEVERGTVLYEIDPRPYQAAYDATKAQVAQNKASLELAKQNNARFKKLAKEKEGAVTQVDLDVYQSQEDQALANLDQARANLVTAKLNLDWTKVTSPVAGRISRLLVTRGNLIVANVTTLTTIASQDPMWVYFDMDEPTAMAVRKICPQESGREGAKTSVGLQLSGETGFPHKADLDFVNNQFDQSTATLLIRGTFPNPKPADAPRAFVPNNFVRVRVPTTLPYPAVLVHPEAVGTDQDLRYVYVVEEDNKVVRHNVKLGSLQDGLQVITEGLEPGKRVVVKGLQRVQQGATVNPTVVPMPVPPQGPFPVAPPPVLREAPTPPKKK